MFLEKKNEIVKFAKKVFNKGFVAGNSGNLSIRVNSTTFLITPKSKSYDSLKSSDIVLVDLEGNVIEGNRDPSSEKKLHGEIYKYRKDVNSIIHTHSLYVSVLAALELSLPVILDEQIEKLGGEIKVARYAISGSIELAKEAMKALGDKKAVILSKHGAVAIGKDIKEAFLVCELLENLSKIYIFMKLISR